MSKIKNGGIDQYGKVKALTGSAVKGLIRLPLCMTDVDECHKTYSDGKIGPCDVNAECVNTAGSYQCVCRDGYSGDGLTCTRTSHKSHRHTINRLTLLILVAKFRSHITKLTLLA